MNILIVGAGIVGRVTALQFIKSGIVPTVIDNVFNANMPTFFSNVEGKESTVRPFSRVKGSPGGEVVWGGNSSAAFLHDDENSWPMEFIEQLPKLSKKLETFGFPRLKPKAIPMPDEKVSFLDSFITKQGKPNMLDSKFNKAVAKGKVKFIIGQYMNLAKNLNSDKYDVLIADQDQGSKNYEADVIIFATGSIGNREIFSVLSEKRRAGNFEMFNHPGFEVLKFIYKFPQLSDKKLHGAKRWKFIESKTSYLFKNSISNQIWTLRFFAAKTLTKAVAFQYIISELKKKKLREASRVALISIFAHLTGRTLCSEITVRADLDFMKYDEFDGISWDDPNKIDFIEIKSKYFEFPIDLLEFIKKEMSNYQSGDVILNPAIQNSNFISVGNLEPSSHIMGTTRVSTVEGDNGLTSTFELPNYTNVFFVGNSTFPTSVFGHPTFMGALTGLHVANLILQKKFHD